MRIMIGGAWPTAAPSRLVLLDVLPSTRRLRFGTGPGTSALLVIAVVIVSVCAATGLSPSAAWGAASDASTAQTRIAWRDCGDRLQCARVRVPLDWLRSAAFTGRAARGRPRERTISLAVIRHLASRRDRRIGSLFVNPGGPGGSVTDVRESGAQLDAVGGGRFDVIGWDIRGAGASTHVRCFATERSRAGFFADWVIPTTAAASPPVLRRTAALARRCGALSGPILRHMSTADTARDLDHLRRLVGDRQLTYRGISAGTFLGQTYANMFPRRVRAMVLDGVLDPMTYVRGPLAAYTNQLSFTDRAFGLFMSLCQRAGPARCALAGRGSVVARVDALWSRLRRGSIPAPAADPPGRLTYGDALAGLVVRMSGSPGTWPDLAAHLELAVRGDGSPLLADSRALTAAFSASTEAPGLPAVGLTCADSPAREAPGAWPRVVRRLRRVSFAYGPVLSWWRWAPCASWPAHSADRYTGPWDASTPNPILVIGTRFDPNTPYANAQRTARRLGNAVLLTHDGYSHTSPRDPSSCVERATTTYLVGRRTPPRGTVCRSNRPPFDPDFGDPLP